jgi:hypothetical protein
MKILKYKWVLLLALFAFSACENFEEMNYDPNKPSFVPTSALLTQAQGNLVFNMNGELAQLGSLYAQHLALFDYQDKSNYLDNGISSYSGIYSAGLADLQEIIDLNNNEMFKSKVLEFGETNNQIAVAKILQIWAFHNITDVWGDIPYSEALQGKNGIIAPVYDTQESIYKSFLSGLAEAIGMLNTSPNIALQGDLIFDGDMAKWKAFAHSLQLRIAMRLSEADNATAKTYLTDANFNAAFKTSADYARFNHYPSDAESNPIYQDNVVTGGGDFFGVANTLLDTLHYFNDPRISKYANAAVNTGLYVGLTYGLPTGTSVNDDLYSLPGNMYASQTAPSVLMTAAEILFIKAEAQARGWLSGTAATTYTAAITASMEYNGVGSTSITNYLAQAEVQYNQTKWREQIGLQKWIALYMQGIQAWAEWRRLDYPVLTPGPGATLTTIPRRRAYSTDEYSTNKANVETAVARLTTKEDKFTEKVWWDK